MTVIYHEWVPYRLTLRPPMAPNGGTWQQLDSYAAHLRAVGIVDPTKSGGRRAAAEVVRDEAQRHSPAALKDENMAARIADGSLSVKEAAKKLAAAPDRKEMEASATKVRQGLEEQVRELVHLAALAIHEHDWLPALQAIAKDAIAKRDQHLWDACHSFAAWLRDPAWARVCALSAAMANNVQDADWWLYSCGDAGRGIFLWQVEHCPSEVVPGMMRWLPDGKGQIVPVVFKNTVALPTVADFAENAEAWGGVGLFAAEQVIANQDRALAAQDAELAALMSAASPPENAGPKKRRVFVGG